MRDLLSRLRLVTLRALEVASEFVAGPEAVATHAEQKRQLDSLRDQTLDVLFERDAAKQAAADAERRETLAMLALRDLVRACERCAGLPAAMAAARVLLGEELPPVLAASGLPVAPDDDEPAVGDLPVSP